MDAVLQLSSTVGIESACDVLGVARASFYRQRPLLGPAVSASLPAPVVRPTPARALSLDERESVRADWVIRLTRPVTRTSAWTMGRLSGPNTRPRMISVAL